MIGSVRIGLSRAADYVLSLIPGRLNRLRTRANRELLLDTTRVVPGSHPRDSDFLSFPNGPFSGVGTMVCGKRYAEILGTGVVCSFGLNVSSFRSKKNGADV